MADDRFVGRARTIRIFLPDGTLVMDSCGEGYRLVPWRWLDNARIEWTEDTARIEARIVELTNSRLQLRLQLRGETKDETYRLAAVPTVCPDMPRSSLPSSEARGDAAAGVVTPAPTVYRCGGDTFKVVFEEDRASVTLPDGLLMTLARLESTNAVSSARTFTNGRLTFVEEKMDGQESRVLFARGRMAPVPCTRAK